jgi:hypothetical protein
MTTTVRTYVDVSVETGPLEILAVAVVVFALAFIVNAFVHRPPRPKP